VDLVKKLGKFLLTMLLWLWVKVSMVNLEPVETVFIVLQEELVNISMSGLL